MAECKTCKHAVQNPQIMYFYCMNNERNKNTEREERYKRTQSVNCPYWHSTPQKEG